MASDNDKAKAPGRRKRPVEPHPIELEATEIREESPAGPPQGEPAAQGPAEAPTGDVAPEPAGAEPHSAESKPEPEPEVASRQKEHSPDQPPREAAATAGPRRAGMGALVAAGLAGGAVALALAAALSLAGLWPQPGDGELRGALAEAESRIAALEAAEPEAPPPAADPEMVEALAARLAALESRLDEAAPAPDFGPLEERLSALEEAAAPDLAGIEQRLDALEAAPPPAALADDAGQRFAELEQQLEQLAGQIAPLDEGLSRLETGLAEERGARETLADRIDRLQDMIGEAEAVADRALARAAVGAVALSGMARAVDTGQPYAAELAAIRPLVADDAAVATLAAHAETGLPTVRALADGFTGRATAILAAGEDPARETGLVGRMTDALGGLVRVRPAGPVEGEGRAAVVSRIEAALAEGDTVAAHAEWQALDPAARAAAAEWGEALEARRAAERELSALTAAATAALSAPPEQSD